VIRRRYGSGLGVYNEVRGERVRVPDLGQIAFGSFPCMVDFYQI
jgi:hypothetical protein